jgi:hypothetical protein
MIAGISLEWMDIGNSYLFNALFYLRQQPALSSFTRRGAGWQRSRFPLGVFRPAVSFLEPIVLAMVLLDFIVAGVGYYRPLLPIFAKDVLYVRPAGFAYCPQLLR